MIHLDTCNLFGETNLVDESINNGHVSRFGPYVEMFENKCKQFLGVEDAVATNSGTTALFACLKHINVANKEVIIPALTFKATENAVKLAGGIPVVVDVDIKTWCISPKEIKNAITKNTKCIIPVHLYGNICDMEAILKIANDITHKIYIIEDACEAFGSPNPYQGDYQCFSFNGNKTITTGQGGLITSNKHDLKPLRELIDNKTGIMNGMMPNINAALGLSQMEHINELIAKKRKIRKWYQKYLPTYIKFQENNGVPWMTTVTSGRVFPEPHRKVFKPLLSLPVANIIYYCGSCLPSSTLNTKKQIKEYCNGIL